MIVFLRPLGLRLADLENPRANAGGQVLEAVTKDQLNTGLTGQIRYRVSDKNLYAYLFGVKRPIAHVMGYWRRRLSSRGKWTLPSSRPATSF